MKICILSFLFITMVCKSHGQSYKRAKVYTKNQLVLKATNLEVANSQVDFLNRVNGKRELVALSKVSLIKIPKGNHLVEGALFGAGTLALTALLIDIDPDPLLDKKRDSGFYIGYIGVGTLVGAMVGILVPKWKSIYAGGKFIGSNGSMNLNFGAENHQVTIKMSITL